MSFVIPLPTNLPYFDVGADLDGVLYTLRFRWNERADHMLADGTMSDGAWFVTVLDEPGETVLAGDERIGVTYPLYSARNTGRQPPGVLVAVDTSGAAVDPGATVTPIDPVGSTFLSELGARVQLVYFTAAEVAG